MSKSATERIGDIAVEIADRLHALNCCINPDNLSPDDNRSRLIQISQRSLEAVLLIGAEARTAIPCHSCRSVAHSIAKDWGPILGDPGELSDCPQGAGFQWANQRQAFLNGSGFQQRKARNGGER